MVLKNYYKMLEWLDDYSCYASGGPEGKKDYHMVDINGNNVGQIIYSTLQSYFWASEKNIYSNTKLRKDLGVRIGKGEGDISINDYSLSDDCTADISSLNITDSYGYNADNNDYEHIYTITGTNNSQSAITITEIGLTKILYGSSSSPYYTSPILIAKINLDEPISVDSGDGFIINVVWSNNNI